MWKWEVLQSKNGSLICHISSPSLASLIKAMLNDFISISVTCPRLLRFYLLLDGALLIRLNEKKKVWKQSNVKLQLMSFLGNGNGHKQLLITHYINVT